MSASSIRLLDEHRARHLFERLLGRVRLCLATGDAYRHIEPLVEACEYCLTHCGDSILTDTMRENLERTKRVVACRHVLLSKEKAND